MTATPSIAGHNDRQREGQEDDMSLFESLWNRLERLDLTMTARDYMKAVMDVIDCSEICGDPFGDCSNCDYCGATDTISDAMQKWFDANTD